MKPSEKARMGEIRRIGKDRAKEAGITLARAFSDDPFLNWLVDGAPEGSNREKIQETWWSWLCANPLPFSEMHAMGDISGVALWIPSEGLVELLASQACMEKEKISQSAADQLEDFLAMAGRLSGKRAEILIKIHEMSPEGCYWHLSAIGVDPRYFGEGRGSQILRTMTNRLDQEGLCAYLEASTLKSAALYARHGFLETGEINLMDAPPLYPMWREPRK